LRLTVKGSYLGTRNPRGLAPRSVNGEDPKLREILIKHSNTKYDLSSFPNWARYYLE
jgi:hypothetical protein